MTTVHKKRDQQRCSSQRVLDGLRYIFELHRVDWYGASFWPIGGDGSLCLELLMSRVYRNPFTTSSLRSKSSLHVRK